MTAATGRQNEELCAVKRDRDQIKSKVNFKQYLIYDHFDRFFSIL